jgi:hypothetical protein
LRTVAVLDDDIVSVSSVPPTLTRDDHGTARR